MVTWLYSRVTGHVVLGRFLLSGLRVYQALRLPIGRRRTTSVTIGSCVLLKGNEGRVRGKTTVPFLAIADSSCYLHISLTVVRSCWKADDQTRRSNGMGYPPSAMTVEQKILAALARIERRLDDMERRVKAVQQDVNRVKRIVRG